MDPISILTEVFQPNSTGHNIIVQHGRYVAKKALEVARRLSIQKPNEQFIWEAAVLHDIGVYWTNAVSLGGSGQYPYICHGYLGRNFLDQKGFPQHGLVCERHIGVGIT